MLSNHIGEEMFLKGVGAYLKKHAYGNARTNDLWAAISEASGQDIAKFMDPWIRKIGFPVVTVAEEPGQISLSQSRFLSTGDVKSEEDSTTWWIPLGLKTGSKIASTGSALTAKEDTVRDIDDSFYKLNADQSGFYRTNYPPQRLAQFGKSRSQLSVEDVIGLMGDATALAVAGQGNTAGLLTLLEGFKDESSYLAWSQISGSIGKVKSVFADDKEISAGLKKFTLQLCSQQAEAIGWDYEKDEDYLVGQLRKLLLAMAAANGHEATIKEAQKKFKAWKAGDAKAIHQNLRSVVFNISVANGGKTEYEAIKEEYKKTTSVDGKVICLTAMGRTKSVELANDLMDFVTSEVVPTQDAHTGPSTIGHNNDTKKVVWEYTKTKWDRVQERLGVSNICLDRYVKMGLNGYADKSIVDDMDTFFKDKDTKAFDRGLVVVLDTIRGNANYKERDARTLLEWLKAHQYA